MYCVHHQRMSAMTFPTAYRDDTTILKRIRLAAERSSSVDSLRPWTEANRRTGHMVMDERPTVTLDGKSWRVSNALTDGRLRWHDDEVAPTEEGTPVEGATIYRHGADVVVTPSTGVAGDDKYVTLAVAVAAQTRWGAMFEEINAYGSDGEQYDDRAEILSQFSYDDDPNTEVRFAVVDPDHTKMSVVTPHHQGTLTETYDLVTRWNYRGQLGRFTDVTPQRFARLQNSADPTRVDLVEVTQRDLENRREMLDQVKETSDLVNRYSVLVNGKVYLPQGWTERDPV